MLWLSGFDYLHALYPPAASDTADNKALGVESELWGNQAAFSVVRKLGLDVRTLVDVASVLVLSCGTYRAPRGRCGTDTRAQPR